MQKAAAVFQRAWTHAVGVAAAIGLALSPLYLDWLRAQGVSAGLGDGPAILALVILAALSVLGVGVGIYRYEKASRAVKASVMTAMRASFVPVIQRFLRLRPTAGQKEIADVMTEAVARVALFVKENDDSPDANIYRLRDDTRLERVNRSAGSARDEFKITSGTGETAVEASEVVRRVLRKELVECGDVKSRKFRSKLSLAKKERTYRSFVSVPIVLSSGEPYGMISLNSTKKNGLTNLHVRYLENLAQIIGELDAVNR